MNPSQKQLKHRADVALFLQYHLIFPSHGYRWLNAKIKLDTHFSFSDNYAQRVCAYAGIRSISKHGKRYKSSDKMKVYPNLLLADLAINRPLQVVVSDMTAFWCQNVYYELTLYMDLFNNEIIAYALSSKKGDRMTYLSGLDDLIEKKKEYSDLVLILHTDQGSVYSSKSYNEQLQLYNILHSMSRPGTPTDNAAMESINGWIKEELFIDFDIKHTDDVIASINEYIVFFNTARPSFSLNYLTPKQFLERYYNSCTNIDSSLSTQSRQCVYNGVLQEKGVSNV